MRHGGDRLLAQPGGDLADDSASLLPTVADTGNGEGSR